ncbi:MAG: hypothetical protein IPI46_14350 [Bacteroidetes bacterium]|nr:hypothetical protein [Bacteroidota bacterium]
MKKQYLLNEIWGLTIGGAFQRANVYRGTQSEQMKNDFKRELKALIDGIAQHYKLKVSEKSHLKNIEKITEFKHECLALHQLNFGISQKVLNLYLKYLWCMDEIETPPHFPVDRIIQQELGIKKIQPWTQMKTEEDYLQVIQKAREKAKEIDCSLAELELMLYKRRSS